MTHEFWVEGVKHSNEGMTQIGSTRQLIDLAIREQTDGSVQQQLDILKDIVATLVTQVARDDSEKLDICGLYSYQVSDYRP
jgi:hypothetical protein